VLAAVLWSCMARLPDSGKIDLPGVFRRIQQEMFARLDVSGLFEHPTACGAATEQHWLDLFQRYLPRRYRVAPAFVIDSAGHRSRQIDLAVFDNLYSPLLFPHSAGLHIPAESVYAVFEIKPAFSRSVLLDAHRKASSVRALLRTSVPVISASAHSSARYAIPPRPILAGILATRALWSARFFESRVRTALASIDHSLDLGCCLAHGSFECFNDAVRFSHPSESLIFFVLRLLERLREMGTAPAADLMRYGSSLQSFKDEGGCGV
jgi:hypothetical protein